MRAKRTAFGAAAAVAAILAAGAARALPKESAVWVQVKSAHFTILGDVKAERLRAIASDLERFRDVLDRWTGLELGTPRPTYVFVFGRTATFRQYAIESGTKVTTGYYVGAPDADYLGIDGENAETAFGVLYHEYVHKGIAATLPSIPLWLNEGVAEFYSTFRIVNDRVETGRPVREHVAWLASHPLIPLEKLFAVTDKSPEYNEEEKAGVFYAESWALVHMLLRGDESKKAGANTFLAAMLRGEPPAEAAPRAFGTSLAELDRELSSYTRRPKLTYAITPVEDLPAPKVGEAVTLSRRDTLLWLGDLLFAAQHDHGMAATEEHYRAALLLDPACARANAGLAKLRAEEGKHAEAEKLYAAALEASPHDASILFFAGRQAIEKLRASGRLETARADDPDLARARDLLERSAAEEPDNAEAGALAGLTYLAPGSDASRGILLLEAAGARMPKRADVLYGLVALHARKGEKKEAEAALALLLPVGDPERIASARELLLDVDLQASDDAARRGDFSGAIALLRSVAEATSDADLRSRITERIAEIERFAAEQRDRDRYAAIRPLFEARKWSETRKALQALLETCTTEEVCAAAREVLAGLPK
jgi:tetratricopeptide (TPR) repeat protein